MTLLKKLNSIHLFGQTYFICFRTIFIFFYLYIFVTYSKMMFNYLSKVINVSKYFQLLIISGYPTHFKPGFALFIQFFKHSIVTLIFTFCELDTNLSMILANSDGIKILSRKCWIKMFW